MQVGTLKPLSGMRILITRPARQAQSLTKKLAKLGAEPVVLPTIEIVPAQDYGSLDSAIRKLREYDWVIFTSVHGVEFFLERLIALKISPSDLNEIRVAAIGPATATALEGNTGRKPDYVPEQNLSERIPSGLGDIEGKRILLPRADKATRRLPTILRDGGALVDEVVVYRTVIPRDLNVERVRSIFANGIEVVTFTSPSTVRNLVQAVGNGELKSLIRNVKVACIGPVTAEATQELGLHIDVVARNHTTIGLVEAIVSEIKAV